ncbi:hypothetical protein BKA67DRAFT_542092 [Truncatella angustata]|uniref:Uncharacterized protein n=1 Tax=Truncatella angustata TaxID=152316 RepID=A0A9P8RL24_9PEZI|nr:uncharacterized protein BKA67DRAFT_542092 [Truncatella angustata]KAH6645116.1 hypothetical protein BKA67DRAFT_542092 [Truncatella angustata]
MRHVPRWTMFNDSYQRNEVELWRRWIPQLSTSESAIRHAAIAVGSLLLKHDASAATPSSLIVSRGATDSFAIHHYQEAIRSTLQLIQSGKGDANLAGITCLLFFSIEALQGHEYEALQLFERGGPTHLVPSTKSGNSIKNALADAFSQLSVQWSMFEGSFVVAHKNSAQLDGEILTSGQAQKELTSLILQAFNVAAEGLQLKWMPRLPPEDPGGNRDGLFEAYKELLLRQSDIEASLNLWHERFLTYEKTQTQSADPVWHKIICGMLLLRFQSIQIWLVGSIGRSEMIYDNYLPLIRDAISGARDVLDLMEQSGRFALFSSELALIPTLYIIVTKCRDPVLRRAALALLHRAPMQEGLWNRTIVIQVCERAIDLEEGSDGFIHDLPPEMTEMLVPETMRLKFIKIELRTTNDDDCRGDFVEFNSLPYGFDGEWCITREFFTV